MKRMHDKWKKKSKVKFDSIFATTFLNALFLYSSPKMFLHLWRQVCTFLLSSDIS